MDEDYKTALTIFLCIIGIFAFLSYIRPDPWDSVHCASYECVDQLNAHWKEVGKKF